MTILTGAWHMMQLSCLFALGLVTAVPCGCTPRAADQATPATTTTERLSGQPTTDPPAQDPPETVAAEDEFDPTFVPTPKWLPDPIAVAEAAAETEAEMKPYTEQIAETDETFDMVPIPGGKFMMGSSADEPKRNDDEGPQHEVVIEPFWMGKCEVTWNEYELWGLGLDQQRRMLLKKEPTERDELVDAITRPTKPYSDMTSGMGTDG